MKIPLTSLRNKDEKSSSARASCVCRRHRRRVPPRSHLAHPLMTEIAFCLSLSFPFPFSAAKPNRLQSADGRRRGRWGNIISAASDRQSPPPTTSPSLIPLPFGASPPLSPPLLSDRHSPNLLEKLQVMSRGERRGEQRRDARAVAVARADRQDM